MASNALIAAHDNPFNRSVLEANAFYFASPEDVARVTGTDTGSLRENYTASNLKKVQDVYSWEKVAQAHLTMFRELLGGKREALVQAHASEG